MAQRLNSIAIKNEKGERISSIFTDFERHTTIFIDLLYQTKQSNDLHRFSSLLKDSTTFFIFRLKRNTKRNEFHQLWTILNNNTTIFMIFKQTKGLAKCRTAERWAVGSSKQSFGQPQMGGRAEGQTGG